MERSTETQFWEPMRQETVSWEEKNINDLFKKKKKRRRTNERTTGSSSSGRPSRSDSFFPAFFSFFSRCRHKLTQTDAVG